MAVNLKDSSFEAVTHPLDGKPVPLFSHSHRGFSPVIELLPDPSNRFNGFLLEPQPFGTLQTVRRLQESGESSDWCE